MNYFELVSQNELSFGQLFFGLFAIQDRYHTFIFIASFEKISKVVLKWLSMKEVKSNVWQIDGSSVGPRVAVLAGFMAMNLPVSKW